MSAGERTQAPMPPEARKLAKLAVATVLAWKILDDSDLRAAVQGNEPGSLNKYADDVATIAALVADKLLAKSGL